MRVCACEPNSQPASQPPVASPSPSLRVFFFEINLRFLTGRDRNLYISTRQQPGAEDPAGGYFCYTHTASTDSHSSSPDQAKDHT